MGQSCSSGGSASILKYAAVDVRSSEKKSVDNAPDKAPGTPENPTQHSLASSRRRGSFKGNMVKDYSTEIKNMYQIVARKILGSGASSEVVRIKHKVTGLR
jgi:hypothetical protein